MQVKERTFFGGADSFVTLRHMTIRGTNFKIGQKVAELAIEQYGQAAVPLPVNRELPKRGGLTSSAATLCIGSVCVAWQQLLALTQWMNVMT